MRKKITAQKENFNRYLLVAFLFSILLGFAFYLLTKKSILFIFSVIFSLAIYFLTQDEIKKEEETKKKQEPLKELISFLDDYYFFTSMSQSYKEGFLLSYENMPSSHLKDSLTDFKENSETTLPLSCLNTMEEHLLIDMIQNGYYREEEVTLDSLKTLKASLEQYKKDSLKETKYEDYYLLPLLQVAIYLIILLYRLFFK